MAEGGGLRRGKWTVEEERYVERVIRDFNNGLLHAAPGTTLRNYLSEKLNCDPMRITKKFTGDASIGKRVYHPRENAPEPAVERARREVAELEAAWRSKLQSQARESAASERRRGRHDDSDSDSTRDVGEAATRRIHAWLRRARRALKDAGRQRTVSFADESAPREPARASKRRRRDGDSDDDSDDPVHDSS
ncbi:hypothetical protein JL722_6969 [Aureococcus anophagefferens]|nr:hypothetical protein JL722_6969 [Aureococcus anophagefferens]